MSQKLALSSLFSVFALSALCVAAASIAPNGDSGAPFAPNGAISAQAEAVPDLRG